jgi:hypothetical protein
MNPKTNGALLTKTELEWLNRNIQLSNAYQRKIKSDIKKKFESFDGRYSGAPGSKSPPRQSSFISS